MASLNRVLIIGNLGSAPEIRTTGGGQTVATLSVATNEVWNDKAGQKQERTEWHKVIVWGRQAEFCGQYLQKGSTVFVEGRIQTRSWDDKDGQKRYTTEIVASNVQSIGGRGGADNAHQSYGEPPVAEPVGMPVTTPSAINDVDVPF
ncbi:MAG TPA: single-stranded DNA-binding protein [Myxococcota bacterium]|nr:single-stranded DNA-binding protein [Myxococcota bacterium]HOA13144.1 single-stranded DNA-binding protein [Myxococcota bacterium]HOC99381.1 single-stranded DNA-binding protein [Myxococcota bacterium]HOH75998.1 single-stranded DNA-binding protein [Myxococcota bacterium]HPV05101.1 single-stranded DNA-binding protein [Myxococcota bacterium]